MTYQLILRCGVILATCCAWLVAVVDAAAPKMNYLFPAGVARGQSVTITASVEFPTWPVQAWLDRAGVTVFAIPGTTARADMPWLTIRPPQK